MFLAEEIVLKDNIGFKIEDLIEYLIKTANNEANIDASKIDNAVNVVFGLLDEYQQKSILVDRANRTVKVNIGKSEILVADAISIRDTIQRKINVLTILIDSCKSNKNNLFDIHELIKNRDKLIEEFSVLDNAIEANNWRVKIGE